MNEFIYVLQETVEEEVGLRESEVLATSFNIQTLKNLMQEKIEEDNYGFIERNGVQDNESIYFLTNYVDGFVEYSIYEVDII